VEERRKVRAAQFVAGQVQNAKGGAGSSLLKRLYDELGRDTSRTQIELLELRGALEHLGK
jgi:hypothetical protein